MFFADKKDMTPEAFMLQASMGPIFSKVLYTVAQLNIADLLVKEAKSADELAQTTKTYAPSLYRLLHFLTGFNIFAEDEQGRFSLTPLSDTLRTDAPASTREWILFNAEPWRWEIVQAMMDVVSTGKNAYENLYQKDTYTFFYEKPETGMAFCKAMKSWSSSLPASFLDAYDLSGIKTIVDIGGGFGNLLFPILKAQPTTRGILLETPPVAQEAKKLSQYEEVADRCEIVAGNFADSVPEGGDLYIIATVLMDRSDRDCLTILRNCYNAMDKSAKLLVIEPLDGSFYQSSIGKFVDIMMLLETSGRIRKEEEWKSLLQEANFTIKNIIPMSALSTYIIEIVPL